MKQEPPWDPFRAWTSARWVIWGVLACVILVGRGSSFLHTLNPPTSEYMDFFQDWASGSFFLDGLPVYGDQYEALTRYLGRERDTDDPPLFQELNGHPPASLLLVLPFGLLDFPSAVLAWNLLSLSFFLLSLWLILRQLGLPLSIWGIFPAITLILLCSPLLDQFEQGQFNLILLILIVGCWAAERSERPYLAGALLATATAVKLFPGLLFVYFVLRRRWDVVAAGVVGLALLGSLSLAVFGLETHREFVTKVLPHVSEYRGSYSLLGIWSRLFDEPDREGIIYIERLWVNRAVANIGVWVCRIVVLAFWARAVYRSQGRREWDHAFGLTISAMLLVSPVTWLHYYVLLLLPLALLWRDLPPTTPARLCFLLVLLGLWMTPFAAYDILGWIHKSYITVPTGLVVEFASPWHVLTVISVPIYALLGTFLMGLWYGRSDGVLEAKTDLNG